MNNKHRLALALLVGLAAPASGCTVDADNPMFIIHNQALDDECLTNPTKSQRFISRGLLDASFLTGYLFTPLVESRTEALVNTDPLQRAILIEGAEVKLIIPDGAADTAALDAAGFINFSQRFSGTLEPSALSNFIFDIIPPEVSQSMSDRLDTGDTVQVLAEVEIFGELGNGSVRSPVFTYPIVVCDGCLSGQIPSCIGYLPPESTQCLPGQDGYIIDCCNDSLGTLHCPGVPEA